MGAQVTVPLWSASKLPRICGHASMLDGKRERPRSTQLAADAGSLFHALVAFNREEASKLIKGLPAEMVNEAYGWWATYQETANVPAYAHHEMVMGIDENGEWLDTEEFEPHRYRAKDPKKSIIVGGRADLVWVDEKMVGDAHSFTDAYVVDMKTGRTHQGDPDSSPQLMVHGLAALSRWDALTVRVGIWYARDAAYEWGERMEAEEARERWLPQVREMAARDESPVVGAHCSACWSRKDCGSYRPEERR